MATEVVTTTQVQVSGKKKGPPPPLGPFSLPVAASPKSIKKAVLIFNPVSGGKKGKKRVDKIVIPMFQAAGAELVLLPTERPGHATELAKTCDLTGVDALLACGGDGTLSDVATGFLTRASAEDVVMGFIPSGTGNTVMHDILGARPKADKGVRTAVEVILAGRTRKIDCCKVESTSVDGSPLVRHSINIVTAGLGVDANAAAEKRRWMGPLRYDFSIITELLKIGKRKPLPCTLGIDGQDSELDLFVLTIMNNKHSGVGLRLSPYAQMDDGKIDLMYTPKPIKKVGTALRLDGMIKKKGIHVNDPLVAYSTASSTITLTSQANPVRIMCDGDSCGFTPLNMTVLKNALTILTPENPGPC